jgi:hypothetical protein
VIQLDPFPSAYIQFPHIGNYPDWDPQKIIRIQTTYYSSLQGQPASYEVYFDDQGGGIHYEHAYAPFDTVLHGDGWRTDVVDIVLPFNPMSETLEIWWAQANPLGPVYVDQVVIDTICPEPATVSLLILGGIVVLRRRRS